MWPTTIFGIILALVAGGLAGSALVFRRVRRGVPGIVAAALVMFTASEWLLCHGLELAAGSYETKLWLLKLGLVGAIASTPPWIVFVLVFIGRNRLNRFFRFCQFYAFSF